VLSKVLLQHAIATGAAPLQGEQFLEYPANPNRTDQVDEIVSDVQFIENAFESIAAASCNRCLSMMIRNLNDRTHYVRLLDLEMEERRSQILHRIKCLIEQVRSRNIPDAIDNLQEHLQLELLHMPKLVKEGLARSYSISAFDVALSERIARSA
jgi:DNA-binding GntR family transcriptional regulator